MIEHFVRLGKRGNSQMISIPKPIIKAMGWQSGGYLQLLLVDDGVLLVRPEVAAQVALRGKPVRGRTE